METKYTPGVWIPVQERHFWVVEDSEGQRLASLLESECVFPDGIEHDDAEANAKLMAAAPDLFEALITLMRVVSDPDCAEGLALGSARAKATSAIAKATA